MLLHTHNVSFYPCLRLALFRFASTVVPPNTLPDFKVKNDPILGYLECSKERTELKEALEKMAETPTEVPICIGDKEIKSDICKVQVMPHNHKKAIANFYYADKALIKEAIEVATNTQKCWDRVPVAERLQIWAKAGDLMAGKFRPLLNAATMLGQSKTCFQAEIDAAVELIDFVRLNAYFFKEAHKYQPHSVDAKVTKNSMRYRGIDGFVASISPFNFTAIGGNLGTTPALVGNSVIWKPSDTAMLSNYYAFKAFQEAGLPPGVINFVPADGPTFGDTITASKHLAGINFTGSVPTFTRLWDQVGKNINNYVNFPRLIGECGGKNYHLIHPSADLPSAIGCTIRSAFEYMGQKCSACSRLYVAESIWPEMRDGLLAERDKLKVGDPVEFDTFASAVIDEKAFDRISDYIDHACKSDKLTILAGGNCDDSCGYYIEPTIIQTTDPHDKMMTEEIFGPILTCYVFKDADICKICDLITDTTPFALTGSIFGHDQKFLEYAYEALKMSAGNFYVNDKSTGAVVGQQPFGGARMSGTNDKAGGPYYVLRWANPQSVKESFVPMKDITYPYMSAP